MPDDLWDEIKIILPPEKPDKTVGRPVVPFRKILDGILYVLRTGCQWKMLPKEYGSGSTCHRRFQEWTSFKVFEKLWIRLLEVYDDIRGILDGNGYRLIVCFYKSSFSRGDLTGRNPTD
jgi:transposase